MRKKVVQFIGSAVLTALLGYAVFSDQSLSSFAGVIANVDRTLLLSYAALSLFGVLCRALRYKLLLSDTTLESKTPSTYQMCIITLIRNAFVDLLPARLGEASFIYVCKRYGFAISSALSTFGVCIALDIIVLFGLLFCFFLFQLGFGGLDNSLMQVTPLSIGILTAVLLTLSLILYQLDSLLHVANRLVAHLLQRITPGRIRRLGETLLSFLQTVQVELREIKRHGSYPVLALLTAGLRAAKYLSLYLLLLAVVAQFGVAPADISPLLSTTAFIGAEASASLPISGLMGFGAYEAAWSAIFSISSVEIPSIPAVILAVHIITQVFGYSLGILGLAAFLFDEYRSVRAKGASNRISESKELASSNGGEIPECASPECASTGADSEIKTKQVCK